MVFSQQDTTVTETIGEGIEQETNGFISYFRSIDWEGVIVELALDLFRILVLVIVLIILHRILKYAVDLYFNRQRNSDGKLPSRFNTVYKVTKNVLTTLVWFILIYSGLDILGVPVGTLLAGAGVIGLALSLGAQGFVSDVINGLNILITKQMDIGDEVDIEGMNGIIEDINLTHIVIKDWDGTIHFIPNREITIISNLTRSERRARIEIPLYPGTDLDLVRDLLDEENKKLAEYFSTITTPAKKVNFYQDAMGRVTARCDIFTTPGNTLSVEYAAYERYIRALTEAGIDLPIFEIPTQNNN